MAEMLEDTYPTDDPYIKRLASQQTPCFGRRFDQRDEVCNGCTLLASCQGQYYENVAMASASLEANPGALRPSASKEMEDLIQQVADEDQMKVHRLPAFPGSICFVCGEEITAEQAPDARYYMRKGFWHGHCNDDYERGVRHDFEKDESKDSQNGSS